MDVNPTFGHQELIETLSQGSEGGKSPAASSQRSEGRRGNSQVNGLEGSDYGGGNKSSSSSGRSGGRGIASSSGGDVGSGTGPSSNATPYGSGVRGGLSIGSGLSHVDEAYRRLGQRLSLQAHGDSVPIVRASTNVPLRISRVSGFERFSAVVQQRKSQIRMESFQQDALEARRPEAMPSHAEESSVHEESERYRTWKVAKTGYSDQGEHHLIRKRSGSLLRKTTYEAKELFEKWEAEHVALRRRQQQHRHQSSPSSSSSSLSPQRYALAQLALEPSSEDRISSRRRSSTENSQISSRWSQPRGKMLGAAPTSKGLLSAVLEGHSDSNTSASGAMHGDRSSHTSPSQSISTKDSMAGGGGGTTGGASGSVGSTASPPKSHHARGRCLTVPSEPVANEGLDNLEGNLIVYENDVIVVPKRNMHSIHRRTDKPRNSEYRIQSLLGQGTFAQVFKCLHVQSNQLVALKIVKNKPAYTRQATVEIDVFRALLDDSRPDPSASTNVPSSTSTSLTASKDYMVNLLCYFIHKSHLCLVFEVLSLNLYEVLKRRQFRGLPLMIVRSIVHQAMASIKDLSHKSIVHCDLKPENILLLSDEISKGIVDAGETRRRSIDVGGFAGEAGTIASGGSKAASSVGESKMSSGSSSAADTIHMNNRESQKIELRTIKLIDFGSACFEGHTAHTYIQSRFYRSPEVLLGLPYDSAIDIWSLGCVAAELFLGLPILPGVHEHDQLGRITEMIAKIPDWMMDQGSKATKFFVKFFVRPSPVESPAAPFSARSPSPSMASTSPAPMIPQWRLKTQQEYIGSLSQSEIRRKGGLDKLEKQPGNRYFKKKRLADILYLHSQNSAGEDKDYVPAFVHFLYGLLDPDPWKRWTAFQAVQHPFVTGDLSKFHRKTRDMTLDPKEENQANMELDLYWRAPWDPAICRRKLLNVQKLREKQQVMRRGMSGRSSSQNNLSESYSSQDKWRQKGGESDSPMMGSHGRTPMVESPSLGRSNDASSPPNQISSSTSSIASQRSSQFQGQRFGGFKDNETSHGVSSSLTSAVVGGSRSQKLVVGNSAVAGQTIIGPATGGTSMITGPQSFTGHGYDDYRGPVEGDFAYALQRPGVVPGTGAGSSVSSHSMPQAAQPMQHAYLSANIPQYASSWGQSTIPQVSNPSVPHGQASDRTMDQDHVGVPAQVYTQHGSHFGMFASSASSSFALDSSAYGTPIASSVASDAISDFQPDLYQHPLHMQEQQLLPLTQPQAALAPRDRGQLQFNPAMPFAPQQHAFGAIPQYSQMQQVDVPPFQGQHQQFGFQQQPIYLATAPGGGIYYVTTSASGQPMILQPVAVLNQASNQAMAPHMHGQYQQPPPNHGMHIGGTGMMYATNQVQQHHRHRQASDASQQLNLRNSRQRFNRGGTSM